MMGRKQEVRWGCLEPILVTSTFAFAFLAGLAFLSLYVPPYYVVWFQWLGLFLPVLLLANLLLLLFWAIRRKKWLFFSLIALLSNFHYYPKIYQYPFRGESVSDTAPDLVVASYNVHEFQLDYGGSSLTNVAELMEEKRVQVLCLQEVPGDLDKAALLKAFRTMRYIVTTEKVENSFNVVILSSFPVKSNQVISFPERANCAMAADLDVKGKLIRVLTCHLQTTNWNQVKGKPNEERSFGLKFWRLFDIEAVMGRNYRYRALQADSLNHLVRRSQLPIIVCGDFNDTPISYAYRKMKGGLADSFKESGKGYAYTYRYLHRLFRIDYLFYSPKGFKARHYESPEEVYSDHNPIIVSLDQVN